MYIYTHVYKYHLYTNTFNIGRVIPTIAIIGYLISSLVKDMAGSNNSYFTLIKDLMYGFSPTYTKQAIHFTAYTSWVSSNLTQLNSDTNYLSGDRVRS